MLKILIGIPTIGILLLSLTNMNTIEGKLKGKQIALFTSILTFGWTIIMWILFDYNFTDFQYVENLSWSIDNIQGSITFGVDGISLMFIVLTALLVPICLLASWDSIKFEEKSFNINMLILSILLFGVFSVLDLIGFYILFEGVLIPMFLIIGIWGAREQKIRAAYYFFFYTLIGSVLMLLSIAYIYYVTGTTDYRTLLSLQIDSDIQILIFICFFASLAVKIPKYPFHIWLPLAHVEAPLAGSVVLAGILIKLGSYGLIRYTLPILPYASIYFTPLIMTLGVLAIIYASITTIRQTDLKRIIAYSSVSHMGVVSIGIFSLTAIGIEGSIFLQIAHGIVSSALFIIVTLLYERHHTRLVKYYRGVTITMPIFSIFFFIFTLANIGTPLTCNFIGEILTLLGTFSINSFIGILSTTGMVFSACYALFLYNRVTFGTMSIYIKESKENRDITRREWYVLLPLGVLTFVLGIFPNIILDVIHTGVNNILIGMGGNVG